MNGGPILVSVLGGVPAEVGLIGAALIFTRIPQYVMSPVIGALLPHASRILATGGQHPFNRFIARIVAIVGAIGGVMVAGAWFIGEWGLKVFAGSDFDASREVLTALAALAAFYLIGEVLNQALFASGLARLAAVSWGIGLGASLISLAALSLDVLERVSFSLAIGALAAVGAQVVFCTLASGATKDR
jgi:O-antigen/teichoic acid export membrane protein